MLDRALRLTFRNFPTLFLMVAAISVPAATIYCFIFRNAIAVHELHDTILTFPGGRQVAGVGRQTLLVSRWVGWGLVLAGVLLIPYLARAARRVLEREAAGEVPTVLDALREKPSTKPRLKEAFAAARGPLIVCLVIALLVGTLTLLVGLALSEFLSEGRLWAGVGLARGVAWAMSVPFVLVPLALSSQPSENL
ncbi:MAG: hypothetical protein QOH26_167 [Actinomycetota bacterium]|jgi:hypothetical protein|nr:hypothetical protein [Actinomycetota bacterium]